MPGSDDFGFRKKETKVLRSSGALSELSLQSSLSLDLRSKGGLELSTPRKDPMFPGVEPE